MNRFAKGLLTPAFKRAQRLIANAIPPCRSDPDSASQQMQRNIVNQYLTFKFNGIAPYPNIRDAGFRVYSQFEEDGIILYVLSMIGFKTRRVVEMCCGGGHECMAANLIINHGFDGYLFDGSVENIRHAESFFASRPDCLLNAPSLTRAWITAENVNELLRSSGCGGEVDLLSLDMDGNDYWVWKAISAINPRLIICETHNIIPADKSLTIRYDPAFDRSLRPQNEQDYLSASLLAMQRLFKRRGYRLIGGHRHGFNVFFLREDEGAECFPEASVQEIHDNRFTRSAQAQRWPGVMDMPWQEV
jgi:hypothetical protein